MRRILTIASFCVAVSLLAQSARADLVSDFWQGVKDAGYQAGDEIRVVFVSSPVVDAQHSNLSYYNNFGDGLATTGQVTSSFGLSSADWKPLVTTVTNDIDGSLTPVKDWINAYNVPVFNTRGQLVASSASSMLGASVTLSNAIRYDESGDDQAPPKDTPESHVTVWTGTNSLGEASTLTISVPLPQTYVLTLGNHGADNYTTVGDGGLTNKGWIDKAIFGQTTTVPPGPGITPGIVTNSIYVMSSAMTVPVPEPGTLAMWLGFSGIAGLAIWRKRRKSS